MKIKITYPALFESTPPRYKVDQPVIGLFEDWFNIEELSSGEAPVGLIANDPNDEWVNGKTLATIVRVHDGRFLYDTGMRPEEVRGDETNGIEKRGSLIAPVIRRLYDQFSKGDSDRVYPKNSISLIFELILSDVMRENLEPVRQQMIKAADLLEDREQIEYWRDKVEQAAKTFVIIDGIVWKQSYEPCYRINTRYESVTTNKADFYDSLRVGPTSYVPPNSWDKFLNQGRAFSLLDRKGLYAEAERLNIDVPDESHIEVLMDGLQFMDIPVYEYERMARLLVYDVANAMRKRVHGMGVGLLYDCPTEVMKTFLAARDVVATMHAKNGISTNAEDAISDLIQLSRHSCETGGPYWNKIDFDTVDAIVAGYQDNEIRVEASGHTLGRSL